MKKLFVIVLMVISFVIGIYLANPIKTWAAYFWDNHIIGGGMSGTDGIPIKVAADGTVYIQ